MSFFKVKVAFEIDNGKRVKIANKIYLVEAVSPTDAEVKMTSHLAKTTTQQPEDSTGVFEVKDCVCTKFEDFIE